MTKAVFTTARFFQNVTKYAGNFCKKMCHPFSKIGQSGRTVYNPPSASFLLMLRFLNAYFCFYPAAASICWHLTASRYRSTLSNYDGLIDLHQKRDWLSSLFLASFYNFYPTLSLSHFLSNNIAFNWPYTPLLYQFFLM